MGFGAVVAEQPQCCGRSRLQEGSKTCGVGRTDRLRRFDFDRQGPALDPGHEIDFVTALDVPETDIDGRQMRVQRRDEILHVR